jgi:hypothetical protein
MSGELVRRSYGGQLQRATNNALNEVAARQMVVEAIIKAKSEVGEYAASEAVYLKAIQKIAETSNPDTAEAVAAIINMTVAGIIRTNSEFGGHL